MIRGMGVLWSGQFLRLHQNNFAVLPVVNSRDPFWQTKELAKEQGIHIGMEHESMMAEQYEDIYMPKNTSAGILIAGFIFLFGFGVVWHIWWLAALGVFSTIVTLILRTYTEETDRRIPASEVARIESSYRANPLSI
jgi:cytochrome o ubiquinol oxidase subunit 1